MTTDDVIDAVRDVLCEPAGVPDVELPDAGPVAGVDLWPVPRWPSAAELREQMRDAGE